MMLKSILPSRKIPDADFTMVTAAPADEVANGKENYPAVTSNFSRLRGDKSKKSKGKEVNQGIHMEAAFDKLLVSRLLPAALAPQFIFLTHATTHRTTSKSHPRSDQSSRRWSLPSRPRC